MASLSALRTHLTQQGLVFSVSDSAEHHEVTVYVPKTVQPSEDTPVSVPVPKSQPSSAARPSQDPLLLAHPAVVSCKRFWCVWKAPDAARSGIYGAETRGHWYSLRDSVRPTEFKAFDTLQQALTAWDLHPGGPWGVAQVRKWD